MYRISALIAAVSTHSRRIAALATATAMVLMPAVAHAQDADASAGVPDAAAQTELIGQPTPWALNLQHGVTPVKQKMHFFHDALLLPIITAISLFVLALMIYVAVRFRASKNPTPSRTTHNTMLEVIWTLVPVIILVVIVIPSMKMLYFADKTHNPEMTLKVVGYQWYWGYEYPDHKIEEFTANMLKEEELQPGQPRLLATDNEVVVPIDTDIRVLVTANDVLHSWAVPAFGVKTDAVPGRTNETWMRIEREGTYYGQCSEICGINHSFMPIQVRAVSKDAFAAWVAEKGGSMPDPNAPVTPGVEGAADDAAVPANPEAEAKTPQEATAEDKAVTESVTKDGNTIEDAAKKVADPIPSEKAGE